MPWCVSAGDCGRLNTRSGSRLVLCGHSGSFSEPLSSLIEMGKAQLPPGVVGVGVHCWTWWLPPFALVTIMRPGVHRETWEEAVAVDSPRSQAPRRLKRNQPHLTLD